MTLDTLITILVIVNIIIFVKIIFYNKKNENIFNPTVDVTRTVGIDPNCSYSDYCEGNTIKLSYNYI